MAPRLVPLLLAAPLLLAGCAIEPPAPAAPEPFRDAGAPVVAFHVLGCGFCGGGNQFFHPEWRLFVVFENARAVRIHYNPGEGSGVHAAPGVAYDLAPLEPILIAAARDVPWHRDAPSVGAWVSDVETGEVDEAALERLRGALAASWRAPSPPIEIGCLDCPGAGTFGRAGPNGSLDLLNPNREPPPGTPAQRDFVEVMDAFSAAARTFRAAPAAREPTSVRLLLVEEHLFVNATSEGARLRANGQCLDASIDGARVRLPWHPHAAAPVLLVARALDPASVEASDVDPRRLDVSDHVASGPRAPVAVALRSAVDVGEPLLDVTLDAEGRVLLDGVELPPGGSRTFRFERETQQETWLDEQETTVAVHGVARYQVVEILTVRDAGSRALTLHDGGALCTG